MTEEISKNEESKADETGKKPEAIKENKLCAILSYLLLGVVWYFVDENMKKDELARFHVKQAIVLIIVSLAGSIGLGMTIVLAWLIPLFQLAVFVLVVIGIYNAYSGAKKELPFIGKFGDKIKI